MFHYPRLLLPRVVTREYLTLEATVENVGTGTADRTTLKYYQSSDLTIDSSDTEVGDSTVGSLPPSEYSEESDRFRAPNSAGTYYYYVCVDSVPGETDMSNNCSSRESVVVVGTIDLTVVFEVDDSDSNVWEGERFGLYAKVTNRGTGTADRTTLRYYRSPTPDISRSNSNEEPESDRVNSLDPDETDSESITIGAGSPGSYYYGACVDSVPGETDTTNNCSNGVQVVV